MSSKASKRLLRKARRKHVPPAHMDANTPVVLDMKFYNGAEADAAVKKAMAAKPKAGVLAKAALERLDEFDGDGAADEAAPSRTPDGDSGTDLECMVVTADASSSAAGPAPAAPAGAEMQVDESAADPASASGGGGDANPADSSKPQVVGGAGDSMEEEEPWKESSASDPQEALARRCRASRPATYAGRGQRHASLLLAGREHRRLGHRRG